MIAHESKFSVLRYLCYLDVMASVFLVSDLYTFAHKTLLQLHLIYSVTGWCVEARQLNVPVRWDPAHLSTAYLRRRKHQLLAFLLWIDALFKPELVDDR